MTPTSQNARTGYRRKTSPTVRLVDRITTAGITVGGIMVIVAVLGIMVYLITVVIPLFRGAKIGAPHQFALLPPDQLPGLLFVELDEYQRQGMYLTRDGQLTIFNARTGTTLEQRQLFPPQPAMTAFARALRYGHTAFGFADGTIRLAQIDFTEEGLIATVEEPVTVGTPGLPIQLLDYKVGRNREVFTVLTGDNKLFWDEVTRRKNILTGKTTIRVSKHELPFTPLNTPPVYLLQNGQGDQVYLAWRDGTVRRYDLRDITAPVVAEIRDLIPAEGVTLTSFRFMYGDQSLIVGDSQGGVTAWFRAELPEASTLDGYRLLPAHTLAPHPAAITVSAFSTRDKCCLTGAADGGVWLRHMTSNRLLVQLTLGATPAVALQITPKSDGIFSLDTTGRAWVWPLHNPHPETTWKTIFGKVWYEGYDKPTYTWQSAGATDDFEPKFSLVPLIFGTLKATLYSMLFAVPIALFGAIYTSQFLDKRLRAPIKSVIETMASLPSVVLGFVAALVLAPLVENWIVAVLATFALTPLTVLVFGYLWQMLPQRQLIRYAGWPQFALLLALVMVAALLARQVGGAVERWMFAGDFKAWLDGRVGSGTPLLAFLIWPLALAGAWFGQRLLPWHAAAARRGQLATGLFELGKLAVLLGVASLGAWIVGATLNAFGLDPRDALVGTYVQRNTLVVGFVMGFAVIPIIYTISEDALSSVPEHLKSASLGCGATPWQTAVRVIVPVAMSGIFSACMIGLGRAVGETMIVVMAAGNTPVMDINIFSGLRALSANIAVELPEAVKDSTLYRMLFLAALTLFVMTFLINTLAEIIRQRFRKRAFQL